MTHLLNIRRTCQKIIRFRHFGLNITSINFICEQGVADKQYSWSVDNQTWTGWVDSLDGFDERKSLRIKFDIEKYYTLQSIQINNQHTLIAEGIITTTNNSSKKLVTDNTGVLFKITEAIKPAAELRNDISSAVTAHMNLKATYYRTKGERPNVTLKTFESHSVFDQAEILYTIPTGEKPLSRPVVDNYSMGYEPGFEIEITKEQFENVFGEGETPIQGDYVKLELDGRIYDINTVYLDREFGDTSVWWVAHLSKWTQKSSYSVEDGIDDMTDYTKFIEGHNADEQLREQKDATGWDDTLIVDDRFDSDILERYEGVTIQQHDDVNFYRAMSKVYLTNIDIESEEYCYHSCIYPLVDSSRIAEFRNGTEVIYNLKIVDGMLRLESNEQTFICKGTKMIRQQRYAIVFNRVQYMTERYISMQVYSNGAIIQERTERETPPTKTPNRMVMLGYGVDVGNIHVTDESIPKENILNRLININSHDDYVFIDRVGSSLDGEKISTL